MADGILKKHNTVSASGDLAAPEAQAAPKNAFVIRPAPTGVPSQAEDSIYQTEHTAPYAEAAQPGTSGDIQVSSAMLCGNISLLSEEDILRASDTYNLVVAGKGGMPLHFGRKVHYYDAVLRRVGYKYYVSKLSTTFSFADDSIDIRLEWENDGSAPLYWDWPVMIKIFDHSGTLVYWETLDLKLSELVPGKTISTVTKVPYLDEIRDGLSVGISIKSYDGKDSVMLAMDMDREIMEDSQIIYSYSQK